MIPSNCIQLTKKQKPLTKVSQFFKDLALLWDYLKLDEMEKNSIVLCMTYFSSWVFNPMQLFVHTFGFMN